MTIETCDSTILKLVDSYCPEQYVTTPLKTLIVLTDEVLVYQRPQRLAPSEHVSVDEQIDAWASPWEAGGPTTLE